MVSPNQADTCQTFTTQDFGRASWPDRFTRTSYAMCQGDVSALLASLPNVPLFDLVVTSPPYNIGKVYEKRRALDEYLEWQAGVIAAIVPRVKETGSICWQVGHLIPSRSPHGALRA